MKQLKKKLFEITQRDLNFFATEMFSAGMAFALAKGERSDVEMVDEIEKLIDFWGNCLLRPGFAEAYLWMGSLSENERVAVLAWRSHFKPPRDWGDQFTETEWAYFGYYLNMDPIEYARMTNEQRAILMKQVARLAAAKEN